MQSSQSQPCGSPESSRPMADANLVSQATLSAAKVAPPMVVTLYAAVSKGLPFVISILTLAYLSFQIAHLLWVWMGEWQARREARKALK